MILKLLRYVSLMIAVCSVNPINAEQSHRSIMVHDAKVRTFLPGTSSSVAYLSVMNHSQQARTLVNVDIATIGRVEIHTHEHSNGVMKMRQVNSVNIGANETLTFEPGGLHLMLFEPQTTLKVGEQLVMTLHFAKGEPLQVQATVYSLLDDSSSENTSQHHHH